MGIKAEATPYDRDFFENLSSGSLASARIVLREVLAPLRIRSVADTGCGVGAWLRAAHELGATRCLGIDGDYVNRARLLIGVPTRVPLALVHPRKFREAVQEAERASKAAAWFRAENAAVLASKSWRAMAPLRWVVGRFRR